MGKNLKSERLARERIGEVGKNNNGSMMKIIQYNKGNDIWVEFLDNGYKIHTGYNSFCKGEVSNPYDRTVYGVGFLGIGDYKPYYNGKAIIKYKIWKDMLRRCYDEKCQKKQPTYKGCIVSDEWHSFQNFAAWYDQNYYVIEGERMHLDKDILLKGNKIYSPETCVFVPESINSLFTKSNSTRGDLPIGVSWHKRDEKYTASCNNSKNKKVFLGYYNNPEEAFYIYKRFKEQLIKQIASKYKDYIPEILFKAMNTYEVEITD